jgi:biotin transporter BioY
VVGVSELRETLAVFIALLIAVALVIVAGVAWMGVFAFFHWLHPSLGEVFLTLSGVFLCAWILVQLEKCL